MAEFHSTDFRKLTTAQKLADAAQRFHAFSLYVEQLYDFCCFEAHQQDQQSDMPGYLLMVASYCHYLTSEPLVESQNLIREVTRAFCESRKDGQRERIGGRHVQG